MSHQITKPAEHWIFADESEQDGLHYSNFFGGIIIPQTVYQLVRERLLKHKKDLGLGSRELKWQKVAAKFEEEYRSMMDAFFAEIEADHIRMRVMFRKNSESIDRKVYRKQERYTKLYYQFIKHSFGLRYAPISEQGYRLRFFLDELPDFKPHKYIIDARHISEVDSRDYVIMQCLDIVLGAMAFRLNERHLVKPEGSRIRGKKTIVRERLCKHIIGHIKKVNGMRAFDPKVSTGGLEEKVWIMPYRHWKFRQK